MKALKCDRCGKYYDEPDNENKPRLLSLGERAEYDGVLIGHVVTEPCEVDLCDDCYNSLVAWMNDPNITPINLNGYIAVEAIDNLLAELDEGVLKETNAAWSDGWANGWHDAIGEIRDRLDKATDLTQSGIVKRMSIND